MNDILNDSFTNLNGKNIDITVTYSMRSDGDAHVVIDNNEEYSYGIQEVAQNAYGDIGLSVDGDYKDVQLEEGYNYHQWQIPNNLSATEMAKAEAQVDKKNDDLRKEVYAGLKELFEDY